MANYYVRKSGNDTTGNGLSAATAWATLGKALGASGVPATGTNTLYVGAGAYREVVKVQIGASNVALNLTVQGDPSGINTGDAGEVVITAYLTDDKTAPSSALAFDFNSRTDITVQGLTIYGGSNAIFGNSAGSGYWPIDININYCTLVAGNSQNGIALMAIQAGQNVNTNWYGCIFVGTNRSHSIQLATSNSASYNVGITFLVCKWTGAFYRAVEITGTGANSFYGGGVVVQNSTAFGASGFMVVTNSTVATGAGYQNAVYNSVIVAGPNVAALSANNAGQIIEDYNVIYAQTAYSNVTAGTHSKSDFSYAALMSFGQEYNIGSRPRPEFTPLAGSPLLAYGNNTTAVTPPFLDLFNAIYLVGSQSTNNPIGALARKNTGAKETTTVRSGSSSLRLDGQAQQEFQVSVDPVSTTISVWVRFDSNYTGTPYPSLNILDNGEVGVSNRSATATSAALNNWQQLSLTFTPTAKGVITIVLTSQTTSGNGKTFFDDFSVS